MQRVLTIAIIVLFGRLLAGAQNLQIYFVDVEGGAATLIVSPDGQALLADAGSMAPGDRDAKRIFEATKLAGLKKLDYVLTTHFDSDHVGGTPALARLIPVEQFLDHGDSIETSAERDITRWQAYLSVAKGKRMKMRPGDRISLKGVLITVVSSNAEVLAKPTNGGKSNAALC
jgi:beta-lactamase superfamily II metal-dependent hydrolase